MNLQDVSDKCAKKFIEMAEEKLGDTSNIPKDAINKYCRMLIVYCDAEGKITEGFQKSMEKCAEEIIAVEGMEEIFTACNVCPEEN